MGHSMIAELLGKIGMLDERQVDAVMSRAGAHSGGYVVQQIAEMGYASESAVARAVSIELGLPRIDLAMTPPEPEALALLDGRACLDRLVLPVALRENGELLWLAMADPTDSDAMNFVRRKTNKRVRPAVAGPSEIIRTARAHFKVEMPRMSSAKGEHDLGAIEMTSSDEGDSGEALEVVNIMDESASPLARIAAQLGVEVPANLASASAQAIEVPEAHPQDASAIDLRPPALMTPDGVKRVPEPRSTPKVGKPPPPRKPSPPPVEETEFEIELADPVAESRPAQAQELTAAEMASLEQIRDSMEKGAHVLRILVALCVEKGIFTKEEMAKARRDSSA